MYLKDDKSQLKFAPRCSEVHKLQVSAYSQGQLPCFPVKIILIIIKKNNNGNKE